MKVQSSSSMVMTRGTKEFKMSYAIVRKEKTKLLEVLKSLHVAEINYFEELKYERRKWSYILGRISAKLAVQTSSNIAFLETIHISAGVFGFPVVKCEHVKNIQVSITHTETLGIGIAFNEEHPMGIDIEEINTDRKHTLENQTTRKEFASLRAIKKAELSGFTALWCAKEAISKVLKTGMMLDFSFLEIEDIKKEGEAFTGMFKNFGQYKAVCYTNKAYAVAIVLPKNTSADFSKFWHFFNLQTVMSTTTSQIL